MQLVEEINRAETPDLRMRLDRSTLVEGKSLFLFQILPGHFGTRVGGPAFVQSVLAGFAAQVGVFNL